MDCTKKVVGYVRVSTANQALGDGPAAQDEAIRAWVVEHGHQVVGVCRDDGKSGTLEDTDRPALLDALALLEAGDADVLVVHRLDRLARALHVQEAVLARAWAAGASVWEVVGDREVLRDDPDDPMRTFVRQVMGAAAQLERGMVVARLQGGRRRSMARGGYVGGWIGYGYRRDGHRLVPIDFEQRVIARLIDLRQEGATLREIAMQLNAEGIEPKNGGPWSPSGVRSVLYRADRRARLVG